MVKLEETEDIVESNCNYPSINVQCKDCSQTFGYFSNFIDVQRNQLLFG